LAQYWVYRPIRHCGLAGLSRDLIRVRFGERRLQQQEYEEGFQNGAFGTA
jgi:hypothetical protein